MSKFAAKTSIGTSGSPRAQLSSNGSKAPIVRPYVALGVEALAPALPFKLTLNGLQAENQGIIDSGADSSAFPIQMMRELGLWKRDCRREKFESAGGQAVQWTYEPGVLMMVLGFRIKCRAVFCDTPAPLLGRDDFFRRFRVTIDERAATFTVEPYQGRAYRARPW